MRTTDLFKTTSKQLNESFEKTFGQKINFESFDTEKLEDARNKLRTQVSQVRNESGFNETIENEALLKAQFMLDAINAEIAERAEHIVNDQVNEDEELDEGESQHTDVSIAQDVYAENPDLDSEDDILDAAYPHVLKMMGGNKKRANYMFNYDEDFPGEMISAYKWLQRQAHDVGESAPPTAKGERTVKHIKAAYSKDGKLSDKEKSIAYATAWKQHNNESIEQTGDNMRNLREGEIQQASAIVTAKTMVDRVGRWIEELSGMENDTLLTLGDSIRDEMGAEQAKNFISACAPAIQQALQNLKDTREALSTSVRALTGEEQPANMLGGEPGADGGEEADMFGGEAEPDMMNDTGEEDAFAAAEPAAGGAEEAGREMRESIQRQNNLLRVLAG